MSLREGEKISAETASIATGEIPKSSAAFGNLIWKTFQLGERYNQIKERQAKEELLECLRKRVKEAQENKNYLEEEVALSDWKEVVQEEIELIAKHTEKDKER